MAAAIQSGGQAYEQPTKLGRPRGVGVLAAIDLATGGLTALGGLAVLGAARAFAAGWMPAAASAGLGALPIPAPALPALLFGIGTLLLGGGAILLVQGGGLWRGLPWAWALAVAFAALRGVADLGSIAGRGFTVDKVVGLAIVLAILAYLTRPHVRAYFGRATRHLTPAR